MKAAGVIVEYNPFHNGHLYHLNETKQATNADVVVAVMSGSFLQRGEPALVDKWSRTRMALQNGVDVVIELPYVYATQKAEIFAKGAVSLLTSMGVGQLCFGSESGSISEFLSTVSFIDSHEKEYNERIKFFMSEGNSYPKASSLAFQSLDGHEEVLDLSQPNNILGFQYVRAIHSQRSPMKPSTILRTKAGYHDQQLTDTKIASATGIRHELLTKGSPLQSIQPYVPEPTYKELQLYMNTYPSFQGWHKLYHLLRYKLLTTSQAKLASIYEAEEGLENRLITIAKSAPTFQVFMEAVKTKRYTWTRIQRFALHILTDTTKDEMRPALEDAKAPYLRLLGMSGSGRAYLNEIKSSLTVPLVANINQFDHPFLTIERRASQVYALGFTGEHQEEFLMKEHKTSPIIL
ncbi:nucleotidyltransferase [Pseudalkalibacillus hwajinpoensis]|uniref:tRNA(Met) cytidine acetate ligase n=1 Tax=Guptibacillus hwajinpoensis TaxID=208199 RepID=A0A4U1MLH9_9BACL|nr:nucleotidyltransferase [Pseudalkalibacillus hwajinpoensis]TKD71767.1 nucleotidyltransferase [Pseudalkalibacillus hwajinpoensis]